MAKPGRSRGQTGEGERELGAGPMARVGGVAGGGAKEEPGGRAGATGEADGGAGGRGWRRGLRGDVRLGSWAPGPGQLGGPAS